MSPRGGGGLYFFLSAVFGCFGFLGVLAFLSMSTLLDDFDRILAGGATPSVTPDSRRRLAGWSAPAQQDAR
jgi:hypothetical protein